MQVAKHVSNDGVSVHKRIRDSYVKFTFEKWSLIKINGVIIALRLSKNIYYEHKSVLRAVTKQSGELSRL